MAGSAYTYAYATLGELAAWIIGWDLVLEYALASSTVALGWGATAVTFLIGFDAVSTAAQEAKNPQRDMPRGILWSLAICTALYIAAALVFTGDPSSTSEPSPGCSASSSST